MSNRYEKQTLYTDSRSETCIVKYILMYVWASDTNSATTIQTYI